MQDQSLLVDSHSPHHPILTPHNIIPPHHEWDINEPIHRDVSRTINEFAKMSIATKAHQKAYDSLLELQHNLENIDDLKAIVLFFIRYVKLVAASLDHRLIPPSIAMLISSNTRAKLGII